MKKIDILNNLNFGNSIAEYDKNIVNYYINTYSTMDLVNDRYDIIKGTKGSGKTAMLVTLYDNQSKYSQLDGKRLIKAIELKGDPDFKRAFNTVTINDNDIQKVIDAWKIYIINVIWKSYSDLFSDGSELGNYLQKEKLLLSGDFKMIKKLLSEDASFVYSSHKSSSEEVIDVVRKFETYPSLLAEELGISPVPVLENWAELYKKYGSSCDINLKNNYTKKDILEFVEKNYINIRNDESLMAKLKFELKLGKELAKLEKDYAQSDLGKAETGWDAFYDFMNRANK